MITFCIPSKNNLRYVKSCVESIQNNSYYDTNKILVYVDQDNDGTCEWLVQNKIDHIINSDSECKGIGYGYDVMFREAKTDLVVAFHADMILGPDADYHLVKHHKRGSVVCATRIEPPLHPPGPEKIVKDFGMWPEDIKWDEFNGFVNKQINLSPTVVTKSLFAPWLIHRDDHLGHDPIFLSVFEDADLFRRFKIAGYDTIQSWSSYVYHLTCRGGQFEHAKTEDDFQTKSAEWQLKNQISLREYIRKWGGMFKEYGPCEPKPNKKYNIGLKFTNATENALSLIEPFFDKLYVDCEYNNYIINEQSNTTFDLQNKFTDSIDNIQTDIIISYRGNNDSFQNFLYVIQNLEDLLEQTEAGGTYQLGSVVIQVNSKQQQEIQLKHDIIYNT